MDNTTRINAAPASFGACTTYNQAAPLGLGVEFVDTAYDGETLVVAFWTVLFGAEITLLGADG